MAIDGTTLDLADTAANEAAFGRPGSGRGEGSLAAELWGSLRPGMLLLADRGFWGFKAFKAARESGAELLWRVRKNLVLAKRELRSSLYREQNRCWLGRFSCGRPNHRRHRSF